MKTKLIHIIPPLIAAVLAILGYSQFAGVEDIGFSFTILYDGDMDVLRTTLDAFPDGTVVRIVFRVDGVEIPHSEKVQLMGDTDSAWNIGDHLPLHKTGGVWRELTRYLKP